MQKLCKSCIVKFCEKFSWVSDFMCARERQRSKLQFSCENQLKLRRLNCELWTSLPLARFDCCYLGWEPYRVRLRKNFAVSYKDLTRRRVCGREEELSDRLQIQLVHPTKLTKLASAEIWNFCNQFFRYAKLVFWLQKYSIIQLTAKSAWENFFFLFLFANIPLEQSFQNIFTFAFMQTTQNIGVML